MRILVTGYKGFIGQNLVNHLIKKGHTVEGYDFIQSVLPDPSDFDTVIHLGAISSTTETDVEKILDQNYEFSMRMLTMCDHKGVNFQYSSSASVYGPGNDFSENAKCLPKSPYAWSKYLFDRFVTLAGPKNFNCLVQGFRYFNVYGDFEEHKGDQASPVSKFSKQAKENKEITLFENSDQYKRDFIWVGDVCDVHEKFLTIDQSGIFNVGTGTTTSFQEVGELVAEKYGAKIKYIPMPTNLKGQYQEYTCADLTQLNKFVNINYKTVKEYLQNG